MFQPCSPSRVAVCLALIFLATAGLDAAPHSGVKITKLDGKVRVEIRGDLFTEYHYAGAPHVYFYPVLGPGGLPMTRNFPMKRNVEGEEYDHPHHRSLWYSHGSVNGVDFWSESAKAGKIVHDKFVDVSSGAAHGTIHSQNKWIAPDGSLVLTDEQVFRVYDRSPNEREFDFEITFKAGDKDLVFGDTKEGSMGIRVAETMRLKGKVGGGHIVQSTGVRDADTWGKRAAWCDYHGPVNDKIVGIAIFDHPSNPRHPTWWHVRDYGLFAVNPFGIHDFEKKPAGTGDLTVPAGKSVTFRYRFYMHEGDEKAGKVAERFEAYSSPGSK